MILNDLFLSIFAAEKEEGNGQRILPLHCKAAKCMPYKLYQKILQPISYFDVN